MRKHLLEGVQDLDPTLFDRFMARVSIEPNTGCWIWMGTIAPNGYSMMSVRGVRFRTRGAHTISYVLHGGKLEPGTELDHRCRHTWCVNPAHLEQVTPLVNKLRSDSAWARNARKTHCPSGHALAGANLYVYRGMRHCKTCRRGAGDRFRAKPDSKQRQRTYKMHRYWTRKGRPLGESQ